MATVLAITRATQLKSTTTYTVTLSRPAEAGSKLVLLGFGGAIITARINDSSGALFAKRTAALGAQELSIQDFDAAGGETTVHISLNGAENTAVFIYEVAGLGAFIGASNNGTGNSVNDANNYQVKPSSAVSVTSARAVLFGGWAAATTSQFSESVRWRQMGPVGKLWDSFAVQPGANTQFVAATGLADVTSTGRFPLHLAAPGSYQATSVWITGGGGPHFAVQAAYEDLSGLPTNPAVNPISAENSLPGQHRTNWYVGVNGTNSTIAGYTDKCSYLPGEAVNFKVDSTNNPFRVEIYRLGYYGWESFGARSVTGDGFITGTAMAQPAPTVDSVLGSTSCSWNTNASWTVPTDAAPGIYYVLFRRTDDTTKFSSCHFIVRSASVANKVAFCVPDMTYQAYNLWGSTTDNGSLGSGSWSGRNVYGSGVDGTSPNASHRAYAVSFNRPYGTQSAQPNTYIFDSEYSLLHFMEAQGYDMTYLSDLDLDGDTSLLNTADLVVMSGHQEYWTVNVYDCYISAAEAGVNMLITSSNTALWRTRFDSSDPNRRTMICYKDSLTADVSPGWDGSGYDPVLYTGSWRDSRKNLGSVYNIDVRRENALTGQMFTVNAPFNASVVVPDTHKGIPIWRNSSAIQALSSGQQYTAPLGVFGDEVDVPDGSEGQPANMVLLCPTPISALSQGANEAGTIYNRPVSTTASFTLYRRNSGALVFNTGSWRGWQGISRWSRATYDGLRSIDLNWQNALLAILYDLGATPTSVRALQSGIDPAPTSPSVGAPTGERDDIAIAYGLTIPEGIAVERNGDFFVFFA